jgi:CubicO group peptidase (beta-lactamase class C family)
MTAHAKIGKFNGTILVSSKGEILLNKGYGFSNIRTRQLNQSNSIFQIYSVTKTFTATLILKLVEDKKLSLQDKLSRFYPNFPKGDSITIEHLLTHTSGIFDHSKGYTGKDYKEASFIAFLSIKPLDFKPGSAWSYSNSGYSLLGFIAQKVTGLSYEQCIRKYIFEVAGMKASGFDFKHLNNANKTIGYQVFNEQEKIEVRIYDSSSTFAAGAIYSTSEDLFKYHQALQSNVLLSKEMTAKAYSPFMNGYGYGWMISEFEGQKIVAHSGGADGYRSYFTNIPEKDICIVLLNNNENSNLDGLNQKIIHLLYNKPYHIPSQIKMSASELQKYEGTYKKDGLFSIYVRFENGKLLAQASNQMPATLLPNGKNLFYVDEINGFIGFDSLNNHMELTQNGRNTVFDKIEAKWGINGSATENGWDGIDLELIENKAKKGVWELYGVKLKTGELKFRYNSDWTFNYGIGSNGKTIQPYGENIKVEGGIYDIALNLSNLNKPDLKLHLSK